jgi:tetratricopeptide (TPR) repeat protein
MESGQHAEAERFLSQRVVSNPDDAEAREFLGQVLEAKGDGAGSALQYSRALELRMATPDQQSTAELTQLYLKVKELAPASPLVAKLAATFAPAPPPVVPTAPATQAKASAEAVDSIDPETHYTLGVAYKNMGLLDEAKEEFALSKNGPDFFLDSCLMLAMCLKEQGQGEAASLQLEQLVNDPRCEGAKAQAIRYELGLLYESQEQWQQAMSMYEAIPTFHDVPQRIESVSAQHGPAKAAAKAPGAPSAFRYAN